MKVYVLSGRVEYEDYVVYGVYPTLPAARKSGDALLAEYGGPRDKWLSQPPQPETWDQSEYGDESWSITPNKHGYDLHVAAHTIKEP